MLMSKKNKPGIAAKPLAEIASRTTPTTDPVIYQRCESCLRKLTPDSFEQSQRRVRCHLCHAIRRRFIDALPLTREDADRRAVAYRVYPPRPNARGKTCTSCGGTFALECFNRYARAADKLNPRCRLCLFVALYPDQEKLIREAHENLRQVTDAIATGRVPPKRAPSGPSPQDLERRIEDAITQTLAELGITRGQH